MPDQLGPFGMNSNTIWMYDYDPFPGVFHIFEPIFKLHFLKGGNEMTTAGQPYANKHPQKAKHHALRQDALLS